MSERARVNQKVREVWETNARFWDENMAEGNDFVNELIWPAVKELLLPRKGDRVLDIACGNGLTSRRLAETGADVVAFDFSEEMIAIAQQRTKDCPVKDHIVYKVIDATDSEALLRLGAGSFTGALCNMALMDMADIQPLMNSLAILLQPGGRFVFSVLHPCFNNPSTVLMSELEDRDGKLVITNSVKISRYLTPFKRQGLAMDGQPAPQLFFHRPLGNLLSPAFEAGLLLNAIEERAFPPDSTGNSTQLSWNGMLCEIPPILVARLISQAK